MTTYKPTGEKPDEFNLYLQGRMSALGLDPKTIAANTGIALPTVLTHLNLKVVQNGHDTQVKMTF
ncbi:hypothetical protein [Sutterella wadsworthensis]|nr:hypothetical protein [Sutterella wadsworthensis]